MSKLKQLSNGEIACKINRVKDNIEDLNKVLSHSFRRDGRTNGSYRFYFSVESGWWICANKTSLPSYPLSDFLKEMEEIKK